MGIIEFKGVLNSCAIDENNEAFIIELCLSISFILVISLHIVIIYELLLMKEFLTYI
jgi:hypothetical protein